MEKDLYEVRSGKHFHFDNNFWDTPYHVGFLDLYQIGELCCEQSFKVGIHEQSVYEITYVISGKGFSYTDGEQVALTEGDLLINSSGHMHAMEAADSDIFRYAYIGFRFSSDERDYAQDPALKELKAYYDEKPWQLVKGKEDILIPFMQCIDEFSSKTAYSHHMISNYCEQIVIMAIRDATDAKRVARHNIKNPRVERSAVYSVIRYIDDNIFNFTTIQKMAQDLGYSYTYLSHLFREQTGTTLQNYICYKKIERSVQLLHYGGLTASQVAVMLNYENVQTFSKSFRRIMGVTPTKYIQRDLEGDRTHTPMPASPFE